MQTDCDIFTCKDEVLALNYCSDGFIVDLTAFNNEQVYCYIKVNGNEYCVSTNVMNNLAKVEWKPSEYLLRGTYQAEITFKDSDKESFGVIGGDCQTYCGFDLWIYPTCEKGYKYLNQKCGVSLPTTEPPTNIVCQWVIPIKTCTWTLKYNSMINIIYNGKQIKLNNDPKDGAFIDDDFLDELDAIEENAFAVTLVGSEIHISYTGLSDVEILVGCNKIAKTCE